jgi:hypothetical protein
MYVLNSALLEAARNSQLSDNDILGNHDVILMPIADIQQQQSQQQHID